MELRINTKGVGGKLPNFGFVVFDDSDPVQRILGAKVEGHSLMFDRTLSFVFVKAWSHVSVCGLDLNLTH